MPTRMGVDESAGKVGVASGTRVDNLYKLNGWDKTPAAMVRIHLLASSRVGKGEPMFQSLPLTIRKVEATESRLQSIYDAAKLGLKGDTLALASGMRPDEYRQLCQLDPLAEMAAIKGKADGEREMAVILHNAAREGDAKAALEILKHQHGWVAKQSISVDIDQRISITQALHEAELRVIEVIDAVDQIQR